MNLISSDLRKLAHTLRSFDESRFREDIDIGMRLSKEFEADEEMILDKMSELDKEIALLQETRKTLQKMLGSKYKEFDKKTGVRSLLKEASNTLAEGASCQKDLSVLVDDVNQLYDDAINLRVSHQPAYKVAWQTLATMLNKSEYKVYVDDIEGLFNKNIVDIKSVRGFMKETTKSFNKEDFDKYNKRRDIWNEKHPDNPIPSYLVTSSSISGTFKGFGSALNRAIRNIGKYSKKAIVGLFDMSGLFQDFRVGLKKLSKATKEARYFIELAASSLKQAYDECHEKPFIYFEGDEDDDY